MRNRFGSGGIVDVHPDWKPRGEMYPVEGAFDIRQAASDLSVFREDIRTAGSKATSRASATMCHHINIDRGADMDVLQLGLAIVGDDVPIAGVDEGE
jgi:hypothetical protein